MTFVTSTLHEMDVNTVFVTHGSHYAQFNFK